MLQTMLGEVLPSLTDESGTLYSKACGIQVRGKLQGRKETVGPVGPYLMDYKWVSR
jgi:hypothetical protein